MSTASLSLLRRLGRLWASRDFGPQKMKRKTEFKSRFAARQLYNTEMLTMPLCLWFFRKLS